MRPPNKEKKEEHAKRASPEILKNIGNENLQFSTAMKAIHI